MSYLIKVTTTNNNVLASRDNVHFPESPGESVLIQEALLCSVLRSLTQQEAWNSSTRAWETEVILSLCEVLMTAVSAAFLFTSSLLA